MSKKYQGQFDFDHFFEDIEKTIKKEKMNKTDEIGESVLKKIVDNKTISKIIDDDGFEK